MNLNPLISSCSSSSATSSSSSSSCSSSSCSISSCTAYNSIHHPSLPNPNPNYLDRASIAKLLQPHLLLLSLQDARVLQQPIILTATCYQSINQIIDQLILSILNAISIPKQLLTQQQQPKQQQQQQQQQQHHHHHHHHHHQPREKVQRYGKLIQLPISPLHLQSNAIRRVLNASLAQQTIQAAELAWSLYQNRRTNPSQPTPPTPIQSIHSISPSHLFLQLQIDCQILSPSAIHPTPQLSPSPVDHPELSLQPHSIGFLDSSLDLLLDPNQFNLKLQSYHQLFNTVDLSLRQQHADPTATVLQHSLTIYFLGLIQAFTNYLLKVIITIVQTRLPYPSAIQAHHLVGFIAQDNQIVNFWDMLQAIQAKSSLALFHLPHSPISSPYHSLEPPHENLPKKKSLNLKPLLLTPRTINNRLTTSSSSPIYPPHTVSSSSSSSSSFSLPTGNSFDLITLPISTPPSLYHPNPSSLLTPNPLQPSLDPPFHPIPSKKSHHKHRNSLLPGSFTSPNSPASSSVSDEGSQYVVYASSSHLPRSAPIPRPSYSTTQSHPTIHTYQNQLHFAPSQATDRFPVRVNRHTFGQALTPTPLPEQLPHDAIQLCSDRHDDGRANARFPLDSVPSSPISPPAPPRSPLSSSASSASGNLSPPTSHPNPVHSTHPPLTSHTSQTFGLPPTRPRPRSRSCTIMSLQVDPLLHLTSSNSSINVHLQQQSTKPKSLKQGLSGGSKMRISFEQLMRSNETVKFSLTPSPCLDGSPMSPHSSLSSDSPIVSPQGLADPIAIQAGKRLPSNPLVPRFELRPKVRKQSVDTPDLSETGQPQDQFSSPSSNLTTSFPIDSHSQVDLNHAVRSGSKKVQTKPSNNMSSMSQRIAAARTPDLNSDLRRRPHLQSLTEILSSDPPWLDSKPNSTSTKSSWSNHLEFDGLSLSTPQSIQLDAWNTDQYAHAGSATSHSHESASRQPSLPISGKASREPLVSQRSGPATKLSDHDPTHRPVTRPQTGDSQASGLQKTLRGFKSMISRRRKGKDESQGSMGSFKSSYWKGSDWYTNSIGSRNEYLDQTKSLSALEQSPTTLNDFPSDQAMDLPVDQSIISDTHSKLDSRGISWCEQLPILTTIQATYQTPSNSGTIETSRSAVTGDSTDDFVENKRSRLGRSMSMSSLIRRPSAHGPSRSVTPQTPKGAARSKKPLKSRTTTANSNSTGTSGGTITHTRSRFNSSIGSLKIFKKTIQDEEDRVDSDEAFALATRFNQRFRASIEQRRAKSVDSLQPSRTNNDLKLSSPPTNPFTQHERLKTGSSMSSDYEISVAQQLKPASSNRIFTNGPHKSHQDSSYLKSDDNVIINSYYDSSSQSTAIDEDILNAKEMLHDDKNNKHITHHPTDKDENVDPVEIVSAQAKQAREGKGSERNNEVAEMLLDDEFISLDQIRKLISKLNSKVDQLLLSSSHQPHYYQQPSIYRMGISRVELLHMIND